MLTVVPRLPTRLPGIGKRLHGLLMRESLGGALADHHLEAYGKPGELGTHFRVNRLTAPGGPLGYEERNPNYRRTKRRIGFGDKPLVKTGRLQKTITRRGGFTIRRTQTRATLRMRAPFRMEPHRRAELEAVAESERLAMQENVADRYADGAEAELEARAARRGRGQRRRRR